MGWGMQKILKFNKIYFGLDNNGYINLLFVCNEDELHLFYDGINFHYISEIGYLLEELSLFDYNRNGTNLYIERVTQDFDNYFIKVSNGDVFQIYSMFSDEHASQKLAIFNEATKNTSTPLGISTYEAAVKRANEAEDIEIITKKNTK